MKKIALILVLLSAIFLLTPAGSQSGAGALVVATCGTPPITYTAGQIRKITINTSGQVCQ